MADQIKQNPIINGFNQFFALLFKGGDQIAVAFAQAAFAPLKWPVISTLFAAGAKYLANQSSLATQQLVSKIILDIHENGVNAQVIKAANKLKSDGDQKNDQDLENLAKAEAAAVSFPGAGTFSKF